MNERILLDLFVRSGLEAYIPVQHYGDQIKVQAHIKKFAELIVQECITVAKNTFEDGDTECAHWALQKHFGVE